MDWEEYHEVQWKKNAMSHTWGGITSGTRTNEGQTAEEQLCGEEPQGSAGAWVEPEPRLCPCVCWPGEVQGQKPSLSTAEATVGQLCPAVGSPLWVPMDTPWRVRRTAEMMEGLGISPEERLGHLAPQPAEGRFGGFINVEQYLPRGGVKTEPGSSQ